jgi:hypothetical protein
MIAALDQSLKRNPSNKPILFTAYAHEDFTQYDRQVSEKLKDGLDDVKLHLEKLFIEDERTTARLGVDR